MLSDMRHNFDSKFQETDSAWLQSEASHRTTRQPRVPEDPDIFVEEDEAEPSTYSGYMQNMLRGPQSKKVARPKGQTAKQYAKQLATPVNQRTERLPGVHMAGTKPPARKPGKVAPSQ